MAEQAKAIAEALQEPYAKLAAELGKAKRRSRSQKIRDIVNRLDFSPWAGLFPAVEKNLEDTYKNIMTAALSQLREVDTRLFGRVNERALEYAQKRGAELVGMRWVKGELVTNPSPKWAITSTTRSKLRTQIADSLTEGLTPDQLAERIVESEEFSPSRAQSIAETELSMANGNAARDAWKESGLVQRKIWLLTNEPNPCPVCVRNAQAGEIAFDEKFPSGHQHNPAHPRCRCDVAALVD